MTHEEFNNLLHIGPAHQKIILPNELENKIDRTLAVGMENKIVLHTYLSKDTIHVIKYIPKKKNDILRFKYLIQEKNTNRGSIHENHTYVGDAILFPELCDIEFLSKLCDAGVNLNFYSWKSQKFDEPKNSTYHAVTYEDII